MARSLAARGRSSAALGSSSVARRSFSATRGSSPVARRSSLAALTFFGQPLKSSGSSLKAFGSSLEASAARCNRETPKGRRTGCAPFAPEPGWRVCESPRGSRLRAVDVSGKALSFGSFSLGQQRKGPRARQRTKRCCGCSSAETTEKATSMDARVRGHDEWRVAEVAGSPPSRGRRMWGG